MNKVEIVSVNIKGHMGYDVVIKDKDATVQDYIDALDRFIEEMKCYRERKPGNDSCFACDLCCQERIPVTSVDALKMAGGNSKHLANVFCKDLHVYVEERVVDITMALNDEGRCVRLGKEKGTCQKYRERSLVCHTFICCPSTQNAKRLRGEVVNAGEDELVRLWFEVRDKSGSLIINDAVEPCPDRRDYAPNAFTGKANYSQIRLKDVCSRDLWKRIAKIDIK